MNDFDTILRTQTDRFVWSIWDLSPVNGATPKELEALGMVFPAGGASFVIRDRQRARVVYFQTFDPDLLGYQPMTIERAREVAARMTNELIRSSAFNIATQLTELSADDDRCKQEQ